MLIASQKSHFTSTMAKKKVSAAAAAAAAAAVASSSSSPTGIELPHTGTPSWSIGKELGVGSQGAVYEIVLPCDNNNKNTSNKKNKSVTTGIVSTEWVVKVTPVAVETKKKTSLVELNAGSLNKESLLYQSLLASLRGTFIPKIPNNNICPAFHRKVKGFNCLILERMECSLHDGISQLLAPLLLNKKNNSSFEVDLGSLAGKMMDLAQNIHDKMHLMVDVKPDNLMLASASSSASASTVVAKKKVASSSRRSAAAANSNSSSIVEINTDDLANRLRLIDLGLMTPCKLEDPNGTGSVRGNAMYASLNMHDLVTSSRRDDVEMLLYVLAEIVLVIQAASASARAAQVGSNSGSSNNKTGSLLAWSKGKSDEEVYKIKKAQVQNRQSDFYRLMGKDNSAAADIIYDSLQTVWAMDFNAKPKYDEFFKKKLSKLIVKVSPSPSAVASAAATTKAAAAAMPTKKNAYTQMSPAAASGANKRTCRGRSSISSPTPSSQVQSPIPNSSSSSTTISPGFSSSSPPRKPAARLTRTSTTASSAAKPSSTKGSAKVSSSSSNRSSNHPTIAAAVATTSTTNAATSSSSRAARASARGAKKDSRTIATQTSPDFMPAAAAGHATMDDDNDKTNVRSKRPKPSSSSTTARTRLRLSTESDQLDEESSAASSSSSPSKIRKCNPEVVDLMDVDSSSDEEHDDGNDDDEEDEEFHDCYDDDVEMESVSDENQKPVAAAKKNKSSSTAAAASANKPAPVSVQLVIKTPNFNDHEVSLEQGKAIILGSKPTKTGKWVEVPTSRPKHCTLELVVKMHTTNTGIKKQKVMGIKVTSVDGVTTVDNGRLVGNGKSLDCLDNKITLGGSGEIQTVITISK